MDQNIQLAREDMERTVEEERNNMDILMQEERKDVDRRMQLQRVQTDLKLKLERESLDRTLKKERAHLDQILKQERATMDQILKDERTELDRTIVMERVKVDSCIMQARADVDCMLQQEREKMITKASEREASERNIDIDLERSKAAKEIEIPPEAHVEAFANEAQLEAFGNEAQEEALGNAAPRVVVMEFIIHFGGQICYDHPKGYKNGLEGAKGFVEPNIVEWSALEYHLQEDFEYKWDTEMYYLQPGMTVPDGLVLMTGPEDLAQLMQDHEGMTSCHIYLQNNSNISSDSDGAEKDNDYDDYYTTKGLKAFTRDYETIGATSDIALEEGSGMNLISQNKLKRNRESGQSGKQNVVQHHKDQDMDAALAADVHLDETAIDPADINFVKIMATVSHANAATTLKKHKGDVHAAIQELTEGSD